VGPRAGPDVLEKRRSLRPAGIQTPDHRACSLVTIATPVHFYTQLLHNHTSETPKTLSGKTTPRNAVRAADSDQCWDSSTQGYERSCPIKYCKSEVLTAVLQKIQVVCAVTLCGGQTEGVN
jgi:hypothetical protein